MAKYQSLFEVQGKVGAATFTKRKGRMVIGKTSSLTAEQIATGKEFKRTRENNREFAGSAVVAKSLRMGLASSMSRFADEHCTGRLTGVFNSMLRSAVGSRGKRPLEVMPYGDQLEGFELNGDTSLSRVFNAHWEVTVAPGRNEATLDLLPFVYDGLLDVPQGATHWRLVLSIASVSDHSYNSVKKEYLPMNPALVNVGDTKESNWLDVDGAMLTAVQVVASLPGLPVMPASAALVVCVGVEFAQMVSGLPYILAQNNAMVVAGVH